MITIISCENKFRIRYQIYSLNISFLNIIASRKILKIISYFLSLVTGTSIVWVLREREKKREFKQDYVIIINSSQSQWLKSILV